MSTTFSAVIIICAILLCKSQQTKQLCNPYDNTCSHISANRGFKEVVTGIPALDIDIADPLQLDLVQGDFPDFHYTWHNTTVHGLKSCEVQNFNPDFDNHRFYYELVCPRVYIYGTYESHGILFKLPVQGQGAGNIVMYDLLIKTDGVVYLTNGPDGQVHMYVDKFYNQYVPRGAVFLEFENFNTSPKSDSLRNAINLQSKQLALAYQHPMLDEIMKRIMNNLNKYFQAIPLSELFYEVTNIN